MVAVTAYIPRRITLQTSFKRKTNSYWPQMASSQLLTKHISPSDSGRPISLLYLRDRLTSAQKLLRNEADKEALLWLFSRAHFFLPLLPLGLVKLVWAAYQGPREPHQSAWISSVGLWSGCEKAPASTYMLGPLARLWNCTTTRGNTSSPCQRVFWGAKAWWGRVHSPSTEHHSLTGSCHTLQPVGVTRSQGLRPCSPALPAESYPSPPETKHEARCHAKRRTSMRTF